MLKFGNKKFRNLQEQVLENMRDIADIKASGLVLDEFGIKVVGQESSVANMPTVADYKLTNPDWAYGDAYAIGTEAPYTLYILTREDANHTDDYWFNIGRFPEPGPQGPKGDTGDTGPQGQTGNPGVNGAAAGFGSIRAVAITLEPGSEAQVGLVATGPDTAKDFSFTFGIPKGEPGEAGASEWGDIGGELSNQTDLVNALQGKQNLLVSGTNIKTINNESILGSGNIVIQGGGGNVTDVEVNGVSVVDQDGVAEVIVPTKTSDLTNDSGFITSAYHDATKQDVISDLATIRSGAAAGATAVQPAAISDMATKTWVGQQGYLTSVSWGDVSGKPTFATVATSGSYNDLSNKPTIPAAQVNSDWNAVSGVAQILNKPDLSIYAESADLGDCAYLDENELSIAYSQITGTPSIPTKTSDLTNDSGFITSSALSGYATETWVGQQGYAVAANLATVATSGSYNDLSDKPTIPVVDYPVTDVEVNGSSVLSGTVAQITIPTNYVTTDTAQTISGIKTISRVNIENSSNYGGYISSSTSATTFNQVGLYTKDSSTSIVLSHLGGSSAISIKGDLIPVNSSTTSEYNLGNASTSVRNYAWKNLYLSGKVYTNLNNSYGFQLQDTTSFTADKVLATVDQIPTVPTTVSSFTNDAGYITSNDIPVTDVTLGGTSVLSSGVAVLPAYPTVPTTVSSFTNDAGYQTASDVSTTVSTAISSQTKETWTFTLSDGTTTTKTIVLG